MAARARGRPITGLQPLARRAIWWSAIAIMLWIYFTAAILLFGAVITTVTTVPRSVLLRE